MTKKSEVEQKMIHLKKTNQFPSIIMKRQFSRWIFHNHFGKLHVCVPET